MTTPGTPTPDTKMPKEIFILMHNQFATATENFTVSFRGHPVHTYRHEEEALKSLLKEPTQRTWPHTYRCDEIEICPGVKPLYAIYTLGRTEDDNMIAVSVWWIEKVPYSDAMPDKSMGGGLANAISWYISAENKQPADHEAR